MVKMQANREQSANYEHITGANLTGITSTVVSLPNQQSVFSDIKSQINRYEKLPIHSLAKDGGPCRFSNQFQVERLPSQSTMVKTILKSELCCSANFYVLIYLQNTHESNQTGTACKEASSLKSLHHVGILDYSSCKD